MAPDGGRATVCDDGRLVVVKGATHWLRLEQPERLVRGVLGFIGPAVA